VFYPSFSAIRGPRSFEDHGTRFRLLSVCYGNFLNLLPISIGFISLNCISVKLIRKWYNSNDLTLHILQQMLSKVQKNYQMAH
jgi:hypothetical protein